MQTVHRSYTNQPPYTITSTSFRVLNIVLKTEIPEELQKLNGIRKMSNAKVYNSRAVKIRFIICFVWRHRVRLVVYEYIYVYMVACDFFVCTKNAFTNWDCYIIRFVNIFAEKRFEMLYVETDESQLARMGVHTVRVHRLCR